MDSIQAKVTQPPLFLIRNGGSYPRFAPPWRAGRGLKTIWPVSRATLPPRGFGRPATYETLFGLSASTCRRVSEALHLRHRDVDLKHGLLPNPSDQVRQITSSSFH